jgi:hypothetical protein
MLPTKFYTRLLLALCLGPILLVEYHGKLFKQLALPQLQERVIR